MIRVPQQQSLFCPSAERTAELKQWRTNPLEAFAKFVQSEAYVLLGDRPAAMDKDGLPKPISPRSRPVYLAMFGSFVRWVENNGGRRSIFDITETDLERFLLDASAKKKDAKKLSRIRLDYLRLLRRVFTHLGVFPNPADRFALALRQVPGRSGTNAPMAIIPDADLTPFIANLASAVAKPQWKRRRDGAMQAVMLGAGLTVDETIRLRGVALGDVMADGRLPITVNRMTNNGLQRHTTYLWPMLVPILLQWRSERMNLDIGGDLLFPAGPVGGAKSEKALNPATVYRQARRAYANAGIKVSRPGARTLRNTFAVRELASGTAPQTVHTYLGLHEPNAITWYAPAVEVFKGQAGTREGVSAAVDSRIPGQKGTRDKSASR